MQTLQQRHFTRVLILALAPLEEDEQNPSFHLKWALLLRAPSNCMICTAWINQTGKCITLTQALQKS